MTPVALMGAKIEMVPMARLLYKRYTANRPTGPAGTAHMMAGSSGIGDCISQRTRPMIAAPLTLETTRILSVDRFRLFKPPIKSAIPQPKQAKIDSAMGIKAILVIYGWVGVDATLSQMVK
jgi:hypothetical protein